MQRTPARPRPWTAALAGAVVSAGLAACRSGPAPADVPRPVARATMASGLVIEDLRIGDGPVCNDPNAGIKVRFKAMLKDGTVFEQTAPGESRDFRLKWTIRGWQDGVPGMRVGGLRRLHVPWSLGYGDREIRAGHVVIPPRSDLVFEVELVGLY